MIDPSVEVRKSWFALTAQQRSNVWKRLASLRAKLPRQLYVLALQETIALELTPGRPEPDPCRSQVQPAIAEVRAAAVAAVCMNAPVPKP